MYEMCEQIAQKMNRLFPDDGRESPPPFVNDRDLLFIQQQFTAYWANLPEGIKARAQIIQANFYQRGETVYLLVDVQPGME